MYETSNDSLALCLKIVARAHGISTTVPALTSGLPLEGGALVPSLVERAASKVGLHCDLVKELPSAIPSRLLPAILLLPSEQACVIACRDEESGECDVVYPNDGGNTVTMSREDLDAASAGTSFLFAPKFLFDARAEKGESAIHKHWFWRVILDNAPVYRDVMLAALLINIFALASPLFAMNIYDRVVPNFAVETLWALSIGMLLVIVADVIMRGVRGYFLDLAARRADVKLSASIMEKLLGMRLEARPLSAGSFASNMRSFEMVRDFFAATTIASLIDLPFAVLFIAVIAWLAWPLMLPLLVAIAVIISFSFITSRRMRALAETSNSASAQRNATLVETLVGLDTLKAIGAEGFMQRRWERTTSFLSRVMVQSRLLANSNTNVAVWAHQSAYVAVITIGVYLIADARLSMGGLIAASLLTSRALGPFAQLAGLITQYHNAMAALDSLNGMMAKPVERPEGVKFLSRKSLHGDIEFKNVSFQYPGSDTESIRGMSLKVCSGERVAILGKIGSGKSTLQRLMLGLYQPTSGSILIDDIDIRQLDPNELRRGMGYVSQDVTLFYGSLRQNLTMTDPTIDDDRLLSALDIAGLGDFVKSQPKGLDMTIGERGESLSGGQRKAISIARGIVNEPTVLLLDEPTSSMDHSTEQAVKHNFAKVFRGKTVVLVTHHTSLLDLVDRIVVVDSGRIVADGPRGTIIEALRNGRVGGAV